MRKRYLLDTCAVVDLIRTSDGPVSRTLNEVGIDACAITDITLYELFCGAYVSRNTEANVELVSEIGEWLSVIPSRMAYQEAARKRSELKTQGQTIEDFDLLIGCTAISDGRVLVTGNVGHM